MEILGPPGHAVIKTQAGKGAVKGSFLFFTWKLVESTIKKKIEQQACNIKNMVVLNEYVHGICEIGIWTIFFMK